MTFNTKIFKVTNSLHTEPGLHSFVVCDPGCLQSSGTSQREEHQEVDSVHRQQVHHQRSGWNPESHQTRHVCAVLSLIFNCGRCRCDQMGEELEAEQLEAEIWRSCHQQRRLREAGPTECGAGRSMGEYHCLLFTVNIKQMRLQLKVSHSRCIFQVTPVTVATRRPTGCRGKEQCCL